MKFNLTSSSSRIAIYENSLFYKIVIYEGIEVLNNKSKILIENLKLNLNVAYQFPISNTSFSQTGGWGASDIVAIITNHNIFLINQGEGLEKRTRYSLNSSIIIAKDY